MFPAFLEKDNEDLSVEEELGRFRELQLLHSPVVTAVFEVLASQARELEFGWVMVAHAAIPLPGMQKQMSPQSHCPASLAYWVNSGAVRDLV